MPLLYVYFVITLRRNYPKWAALLWSFALGLAIDVPSNTPGLAAATMTLMAVLQPYWLELFVPRDAIDDLAASHVSLGIVKFSLYAAVIVIAYCLVFFSLEAFSFFNIARWAWCVGGSSLLTFILILTIESVRR